MALPSSGAISLAQFNTELGNSVTAQISLNDADVRALIGKSSGAQASFSDYYGASAIVNVGVTISSNTSNYNIYSNRSASYVSGKTAFTLTINSGVTVSSSGAGSAALDTGTGWHSNDSITIVNNGTVVGAGGPGGVGATSTMSSSSANAGSVTKNVVAGAGTAGGTAFRAQYATTITNNGTFAGGGGGGGGCGTDYNNDPKTGNANISGGGGGGGGAGISAGSAGAGGRMKNSYPSGNFTSTNFLAPSGSAGSSTSAGNGGLAVFSSTGATTVYMFGGPGGARGAAGTAGSSVGLLRTALSGSPGGAAGAAGKYAEGSSNITWSTTGTRVGGSS